MGPLAGLRIIELGGIGPGPFCGMLLADMGADVILVERSDKPSLFPHEGDITRRGKRSILLDLKSSEGVAALLRLADTADAVFEGFRPGVVDKLGVGPAACMARNEKLVYAHMTGWGQDGPLSQSAGHDINYLALSGALYSMGRGDGPPSPPLNLVADYGGGAMMMALGILAGILEAQKSGEGQEIDVSMVEGASLLMSLFHSLDKIGMWQHERAHNLLDGGAPFYDCYETSDGGYVSIGALEPQFYAELCQRLELDMALFGNQHDKSRWGEQKDKLKALFLTRTRDEWCALLEGTDVCFAPVLPFWEAAQHPHVRERESFVDVEGYQQPAPHPRFSKTSPAYPELGAAPGTHSEEILRDAGFDGGEIVALVASGTIRTTGE